MNLEIANRLMELRKKNGLSQEQLAERLGISRQAVSKWERAESSPDTDNLILLSKIYSISIDEILHTSEDYIVLNGNGSRDKQYYEAESDEASYVTGTGEKRNGISAVIPIIVTIIYLILGFWFGWWHPAWIIFLLIPVINWFENIR